MPFQKNDDHIVLITIDRTEARNASDLEHFKDAKEGSRAFAETRPPIWQGR